MRRCSTTSATAAARGRRRSTPALGLAWLDLASAAVSVCASSPIVDALQPSSSALRPAEMLLAGGCDAPRVAREARRRAAPAAVAFRSAARGKRAAAASSSARRISRVSAPTDAPLASAPPARCSSTRRTRSSARSPHVRTLQRRAAERIRAHGRATRRNLEITETLRGEPRRRCCRCSTRARRHGQPAAAPLLHHPLRDRGDAAARASRRSTRCRRAGARRRAARRCSRTIGDVERITARIALAHRAAARLAGLRDTLARAAGAAPLLAPLDAPTPRAARARAAACTQPMAARCLQRAIAPSRRRCCAKAASSPTATTPSSTSCARSSTNCRAVPARSRSARARAHRHRQSQGRVQPRARLLHRSHARARREACRTTTGGARR